ncbi:16S rRNA (cytidine(1402)-2'-O)-methyltransferase [Candidatus Parcubacteria bacterium]|jgi:16S rRNA (cytidine1402-2'-O)-methyltransferase|nr:MAG: 16S rRNA (cytidine(1402)-2'-O)-methyltransferase [Candidatus Parcubacteria bacterium]
MSGTLFIIATPIGNLSDLSARAKEVLAQVDAVLAEDTREAAKLLGHVGASKTVIRYDEHTRGQREDAILESLKAGKKLALVADRGTPNISDPGGRLVERVYKEGPGVKVVPIPGPSAMSAALSVCGFPLQQFCGYGFLPLKNKRQAILKQMAEDPRPAVFFESPHRIEKVLSFFIEVCPAREVFIGRELTKTFEHLYRGKPEEVLKALRADTIRGEFVVVLGPKD